MVTKGATTTKYTLKVSCSRSALAEYVVEQHEIRRTQADRGRGEQWRFVKRIWERRMDNTKISHRTRQVHNCSVHLAKIGDRAYDDKSTGNRSELVAQLAAVALNNKIKGEKPLVEKGTEQVGGS